MHVYFTVDDLIASTFLERLSSGGYLMCYSSVSVNFWCMELPWRSISGRQTFQSLGVR